MSAPLRSNSSSASGPVPATAVVKPSLRSRKASGSAKDSSSSTISTLVMRFLLRCRAGVAGGRRLGRGRCLRRSGPGACGGSRIVNVEPVPGLLHSRTSPPWLASTCLTIARPSPVPPVARERAGSTRKKRSKTRSLVLGGDADAAVGHGDLDPVARLPPRHRDRCLGGRVGDRVLEQVGQRGDQQRPVAVDLQPARRVDDDLDVRAASAESRLRPQRLVARPRRCRRATSSGQPLGPGEPGQRDQLGDQVARAGSTR